MKTSLKLLGISLFFFSSCTEDEQFGNIDEVQKIVMSVEDFKFEGQSRTTLTPTDNGATFKWSANDTVGIFPETGSQIAFPMTSGAGTNTATFTGGGWASKTSTPYMAYYPMIGKFYLDKTNIPVNYTGQYVTANASTEHLGKYDYMVASATTPSTNASAVNFNFKHLGALVRLKVNMKEASVLRYVTFLTDEDVFTEMGYVDLTAESPTITTKYAYQKSKSFQISLNNISVGANEDLIVYFLLPPVNLTGKSLKAIIHKDNGYYQEITLTGKNFEAGKPYELTASMGREEENPSVVNVETAGTFETVVRAEFPYPYQLTSLKVIGKLNGTDIRFIRKMAGRKEDGSVWSGKLTYLDLTEANIVAGGDYYYKTSSGTEYKTENNVAGNYMFYFCNLKTIKFPTTITKLGEKVCAHLPQPDGNENVEDGHIGTFTSIIIPTGVTNIGDYAFAWNQNLASIELPETVRNTGQATFYRCDALTTINIPNSVEVCPSFTACFGLRYVKLSENPNFTYIGAAFWGCKSLNTLTIPANITQIASMAFGSGYDPSYLKELHFKATTPPYLDANSGLPDDCIIYVPIGSYSAYKSVDPYTNYTIKEE